MPRCNFRKLVGLLTKRHFASDFSGAKLSAGRRELRQLRVASRLVAHSTFSGRAIVWKRSRRKFSNSNTNELGAAADHAHHAGSICLLPPPIIIIIIISVRRSHR